MDNQRNRMTGQKNGQTRILLLGCNSWNGENYERSDSIIVMSIDRKEKKIKLASILRDIQVSLHEYGTDKINTALVYGGPEFALQIINEYFNLDIRYYVLVDMYGLVSIIDLLGGIDVEITEMERIFLNCWVRDLAMQFQDGIFPSPIEKAGMVHMDGRFALSHARNRAIGSDFARTERQRVVLKAMAKKIKEESDPIQLIRLFFKGRKYIRTNLSIPQIMSLGIPVIKTDISVIPSIRIPVEGTYEISQDQHWHFEIDFEKNAGELKKFFSES